MLLSYHHAWLSVHPDRSAEWLQTQLAQGFQVHHVDGDHANDDPGNLILIDGIDHLRLHTGSLAKGIDHWRARQRGPKRAHRTIFPNKRHLMENARWSAQQETIEEYRDWLRREGIT